MSDVSTSDRDRQSGRFITGNTGGGRPRGSRNRLGEQFVADLYADWTAHGPAVLATVRENDPSTYLRVVAGLLPSKATLDVSVDIAAFATTFERAVELLGNQSKLIEHDE